MTVYNPPVNTYKPIASYTLSSTSNGVLFSNIPSSYRDLVFSIDASTSSSQPISAVYNMPVYQYVPGNPDYFTMYVSQTNPPKSLQYGIDYLYTGYSSSTAKTGVIWNILDYSSTDKQKTTIARLNLNGANTGFFSSRWTSTNAINSVLFYLGSNATWGVGSTFSLYGIKA